MIIIVTDINIHLCVLLIIINQTYIKTMIFIKIFYKINIIAFYCVIYLLKKYICIYIFNDIM